MSVLSVVPELVSVTAGDLSGIGSAIAQANSLAAGSTAGIVAPAADSVSAELATLFGRHAQTYQTVSRQADVFHREFVDTMSASSSAYARSEAESASGLSARHTADGLRLLGSRQHETAAGRASRLWHPGLRGFDTHTGLAPRLFTPPNELMGGAFNGSRGIVQNIGGLIRQIIENQISYLKLIGTSLIDFVKDELTAIIRLPAAIVQSVKDLLHGNIGQAMRDIEHAAARLFVWGQDYLGYGDGGWAYRFTGPLSDLWQMMQIPAEEMQNLATMLKPLGFGYAGKAAQLLANDLQGLADCYHFTVSYYLDWIDLGKPLAWAIDLLGAPILAYRALESSMQAALDALTSGHPLQSVLDIVKTPASVLHAFLFGQGDIYLPRTSFGPRSYQFGFNVGGIFAPLNYEAVYQNGIYQLMSKGTQTGGLVPALVSALPPVLQGPLWQAGTFLDGLIATLERHSAQP